jgi:hypothetical protein
MEDKIEKIEEKIEKIMTNHLPHIQLELTGLRVSLDWLCKFFWIITTAAIGSLIAGILGLILK